MASEGVTYEQLKGHNPKKNTYNNMFGVLFLLSDSTYRTHAPNPYNILP